MFIKCLLPFLISIAAFTAVKEKTRIEHLPVAGIEVALDSKWEVYDPLDAFSEQPFERVWIHKGNIKTKRMVATQFVKSSRICSKEKLIMQKQKFTITDVADAPTGYLCVFRALKGNESYSVAIKEVIRKLPKNKQFVSQVLLIETDGEQKSFVDWITKAQELAKR